MAASLASSFSMRLPRYDLPRAGAALRKLLQDPDDLPQVFTLVESIPGTAPYRLLRGFKRTAGGRALLRQRPDIVPTLADREGLAKLPEGSLGRAYLAFVESEGISPEGIRDAALKGAQRDLTDDPELLFVKERMRDTHDLWHAATGYKGDVAGEIGLLAFILAQNFHPGIGMILLAALFKGFAFDVRAVVAEGFRRGRAAEFLPSQEWETLLPLPLSVVRDRLRLGDPPVYTPVRTTELRAQGLL